jgi:hypothetical protein
MSMSRAHPAFAVAVSLVFGGVSAGAASAQALDDQWVTFSKQNSHLSYAPLPDGGGNITSNDTQVLFRAGDLDRDGWDDVVAVRKQQVSSLGKRTAVLLMNVQGVLTDMTAQYATASDAPGGDQGFLTPCNNREVAIGDVNNDGWPDVVTCVELSDGDIKSISHPRVYMNLGQDGNGNWLGLEYEEARFPQFVTSGAPHGVAPRFGGMGLEDVTGDGYKDFYFVDFDTTDTGIIEQPSNDLNDRLLINSGGTSETAGWFTDQSALRMTATQLDSKFGSDAAAYDVNLDGLMDLIKNTTLYSPRKVAIYYNDPSNVGNFTAMGEQVVSTLGLFSDAMELGDLNHDAFTDVVTMYTGADKFRLGTGVEGPPLYYCTWGPEMAFTFIPGASQDDGFGHGVYIKDIDGDGWNDVLTTDVDIDLNGCGRRLHIYHNTGTVPGDMNLVLREEAELATGNFGAGWKGVVGMLVADLRGSYDVLVDDLDHDGDNDMLLGICTGTSYWQNETDPTHCQADLGFQGPGSATLSVCGGAALAKGYTATLSVTGAPPSSAAWIVVGVQNNPSPFKGGTLVPVPILLMVPLFTSPSGAIQLPGIQGGGGPFSVYIQTIVADGSQPAGFGFTNAVRMDLLANP